MNTNTIRQYLHLLCIKSIKSVYEYIPSVAQHKS